MGASAGPDIVENGLVLALDAADFNSFKGEATVNLIPSPTINAYPTTGNGWGTYNTNQYNGNQYFSIGSISSVSNNIITTSGNHPLRTYDVVRPQTTGGGVTAGVNYFVKKLSDTTFTLHAYNSSQDGSQGYINPSTGTHKVYDSIANDTRISVDFEGFPTMWWGAPHLPNSGLVKELRYGEFNAIPNLPANDCIRLHYIRTDNVKDGMSYGVDCAVTAGSPVTISFYTRAANANAVGKVIQYYIYNYGASATGYSWNFTLGQVGVWERQSFTYTPAYGTMISYWFPVSSGTYAWDWSCMQVEQKSYVTNFVAGTRGTTVATGGGWADLIGNGNHGELVNGVRESADNLGALVFDGVNDYVNGNITLGQDATIEFIAKANWNQDNSGGPIPISLNSDTYSSGPQPFFYSTVVYGVSANNKINWNTGNSGNNPFSNSYIPDTNWHVFTISNNFSSGVATLYIDGVLIGTATALNMTTTGNNKLWIGRWHDGGYNVNMNFAGLKIYNRALTPAEIQQNFNMLRGRFGI